MRQHAPRPERSRTMRALVIYDDVALAAKACVTLQHAGRRAEATASWNIKPWRVEILRLQSAADEALEEAADAELIIFAGLRRWPIQGARFKPQSEQSS